jgi:FMN reductase
MEHLMSTVVALSGSLTQPSRTRHLVSLIGQELASRSGSTLALIDIAELAPVLAGVVSFNNLPAPIQQAFELLKAADAVVIGSPVYKASYSGLLKHFLDLADPALLRGKVAILAATGGSDRHALVIDHQLRPLASFFEMNTAPAGVYARDTEFVNYQLNSEAAQSRIELVVQQALKLLPPAQRYALREAA